MNDTARLKFTDPEAEEWIKKIGKATTTAIMHTDTLLHVYI